VRLPYGFAERLFGETKLGMRVIIAPHDVEPVDISHPVLFQPKTDAGAHAALLATEAADAAKTAAAARLAAVTAQRDATAATARIRKLDTLKARADTQLAADDRAVGTARSDDAKAKAEDARHKAAVKVAELQAQLEAASAEVQPKLDAVQPARDTAAAAESVRASAAKAARDEARALEPVSVFISRKTQRLYVRRGFEPILDVPITIQNPDQPIGTHIFTAMAKTDTGLRWSVVTINDGADARSALDRITIPQDVLDRIGPTAAVRSSLIVSDEALSPETGKGTEFVAVLSNEPQGGLAMRKRPSSEVRYARQRDVYPEFGYAPQRDRGSYWGSSYRSPFSTW
jgi:hypothetical protein